MIIDSHAYCFEPLDQPGGHASAGDRLRLAQAAHALHHQPAWRVRDRAAAPFADRALLPDRRRDMASMPDLDFRVDAQRGRVLWTIDGEDYTKQYFPPNLRNLEYTPHSLIAEMDYAGVDLCLLHTDPMLGRDSAFLARCVRQYPDRLRAMAPVDEWRILGQTDAVLAELVAAIRQHGLHAIKFIPPLAYQAGPEPWDDGPYRRFWEAATALGVPVFFTLGCGPGADPESPAEARRGYLAELAILQRWMARYPDTVCSLTHGFPWRLFLDGDRLTLPPEIWAPLANRQCSLEVCFPIRIGDLWDYPYRPVWPTLAELVERLGADRLLWGTDMPFQNRFCTYRQSRDYIEKHCAFLSPRDRALLMGGTAARILKLA